MALRCLNAFKSLGALLAPIEASKNFFTKQPPKQLLRVKSEKSPILLSNSTRNLKSGVAYKKKNVYPNTEP